MSKTSLFERIDGAAAEAQAIAKRIYGAPECAFEEHNASKWLCEAFERRGFTVERGVGGLGTAFRAEKRAGEGGPVLGLICEYDALRGLGHACGHHLQGPAALLAAAALADEEGLSPFTVVVYGTPAEEGGGGKKLMMQAGLFRELDAVMMFHSGYEGGACEQYLYVATLRFAFSPGSEDACAVRVKPFEAMQLAFSAFELLRGDMDEAFSPKLHYTIADGDTTEAAASAACYGTVSVRSSYMPYGEKLLSTVRRILKGAAEAAGVAYAETAPVTSYASLLTEEAFTKVARENAKAAAQPYVNEHMLRTGASDFSDVSWIIPACCVYACAVPFGMQAHSREYLAACDEPLAYEGIVYAARTLAGTYYDLLSAPEKLAEIKADFRRTLEKAGLTRTD